MIFWFKEHSQGAETRLPDASTEPLPGRKFVKESEKGKENTLDLNLAIKDQERKVLYRSADNESDSVRDHKVYTRVKNCNTFF